MKGGSIKLRLFKKTFWVPYEDSAVYPTVSYAHLAIEEYCKENNHLCSFSNDDGVIIDGIVYEIFRGYESGSRGNYGIRCKEK